MIKKMFVTLLPEKVFVDAINNYIASKCAWLVNEAPV